MHKYLCIVCGILTAIVQPSTTAAEVEPATISLEEIAVGQRGFGLSVFSGTEPERFEVEVLGLWHDVQPDVSFILARLSGAGLEDSGVIAGMSGSPVYLDERLAGALAFAWPFSTEPIAGITPIAAMRGAAQTAQEGNETSATLPVPLADLLANRWPEDLLSAQLAGLQPVLARGAESGLLFSSSGFGPKSRSLLGSGLGRLNEAGRVDDGGRSDLQAGASVSGVLVNGDLRLAVTGTVTERRGDSLLAFGHPFLGIGPIELPMAGSEIVTVLSSLASSFKIANLGEVVGIFDLDRSTGVRGRVGVEARVLPMTVEVKGSRQRRYELELARLPMMTPVLVAISALGALDSSTQSGGDQGLDLNVEFRLQAGKSLSLRQSFDGSGAAGDAASLLLAYVAYLMDNPLQAVKIEAIDVTFEQFPHPQAMRLLGAHADATMVEPGDDLAITLDLMAPRQERRRQRLEIELPQNLPAGPYSLLIGDGTSIDAAKIALQKPSPQHIEQALELLDSLHSRREIVVLGLLGARGVVVAGEDLPRLPGSIRSFWEASSTKGVVPLRLAIVQEVVESAAAPLEGIVRIDLQVRPAEGG